jgi:hypothetical protein
MAGGAMSNKLASYLLSAASMLALVAFAGVTSAQASIPPMDELPAGLTNTAVTPQALGVAGTYFGPGDNSGQPYMDQSYNMQLVLAADSQILVTFVGESAGYRNSLGYYAYTTNPLAGQTKGDIDTNSNGIVSTQEMASLSGLQIGLVFPNFSESGSGGLLTQGDTTAIAGGATFSAGTKFGFFLVQDGWDAANAIVKGWDPADLRNPEVFYSKDWLNPENPASADFNSDITALDSRHVGSIFTNASHTEIVVGIEDKNRVDAMANPPPPTLSDNDFNDAIFVVHANAYDSNIPTAPVPLVGSGFGALIAFGSASLFRRRRKRAV